MSNPSCIRHLQDYIAIPSVNPMGRQDISPDITGERRYAEHLREQLRRLGLDAEVIGEGERISVLAEATCSDPLDTVLVASHLDTVPVDGMTIDPFDPTLDGTRLLGRGSCDTKGGMAALVDALERVLKRGTLRRNLILVGEADEEFASVGVEDVLERLGSGRPAGQKGGPGQPGQPDWVLATEPTELRVVTHHKGIALARIGARGRACHASDPAAGRNAIVVLARAVLALDELADELRRSEDPVLGPATLSVGVIEGGQSPNIVPDRARLTLDRRMLPGETIQEVREQLEAIAGRIDGVELEACIDAKPPLGTPADAAPVKACQDALARLSRSGEPGAVAFGTDAGLFGRRGIPGVVMGPGSIVQAHTKDEFVDTGEVADMADFFVALLEGAPR